MDPIDWMTVEVGHLRRAWRRQAGDGGRSRARLARGDCLRGQRAAIFQSQRGQLLGPRCSGCSGCSGLPVGLRSDRDRVARDPAAGLKRQFRRRIWRSGLPRIAVYNTVYSLSRAFARGATSS